MKPSGRKEQLSRLFFFDSQVMDQQYRNRTFGWSQPYLLTGILCIRKGHPSRMETGVEKDEYRIRVAGVLDPSWSEWLGGMAVKSVSKGDSLLTGSIADQAHLRGILNKIWDLNLKVISVSLIHPADEEQDN